MTLKITQVPDHPSFFYAGPDLKLGKMPAMIYLSLSAVESLTLDPFNQPVQFISGNDYRVFSVTLPFHGNGFDKTNAMGAWDIEMKTNPQFLFKFIKECSLVIDALVEENIIDERFLTVAGLSRGAFLATHLAAENKHVKNILGFAPLTTLDYLEEFQNNQECKSYNLKYLNKELIHKNLRFYIGNRDIRVGTDKCFEFIHELTEFAYNSGIRSPKVELIISPSIGHKGHGTAPQTFQDGINWILTL